jgi:MFS family permease
MTALSSSTSSEGKRRFSRDAVAMSAAALLFTTALGLSSVAFPLLALATGRSASEIGVLVALAAVVQILARSRLAAVMRRVQDRHVFTFGPVLLATSMLVLLASASLVALTLAWFVLALGRACFWTAGQTHAVRGTGSSVKRLANLNFFGSSGALLGPVLAGVLAEVDLKAALAVGAALGALAVLPALFLERFAPFVRVDKQRHERALWRRPGVNAGCWSGATAGAWRGLMDSFVPVALERARHSSAIIGLLVSVANAAAVVGAVLITRLPTSWTRRIYVLSMVAAACGVAVFGYSAASIPLAATTLAVSGLGVGLLQTLGPALAAAAVSQEEKGEAMAAYGALRTTAMFVTPLSASAALLVVPIPAALLLVGSLLALPSVAARSLTAEGRPLARDYP